MKPVSPVVAGLEQFEFVYAKNQPEYMQLPALVGNAPQRNVISRWELTEDERKLVSDGADVYLVQTTYDGIFSPTYLAVGGKDQPAQEFMQAYGIGEAIPTSNIIDTLDKLK